MKNKQPKFKITPQNKSILVVILFVFLIFSGLIGYMVYFQTVKAETVINNSYNPRGDILAQKITRGQILSSDGQILAQTITDSNGEETRVYPFANRFSHIVGYLDKGGYGLEQAYEFYMLTSNQSIFEQISNDFSNTKNQGNNIVTTLDSRLQTIAYDALGTNRGAVIITEPSTGKILAMVSKPDFDPNTLSDTWDQITAQGADSVLVNRASQGLYPPGSTFKIVTLLEYIRENPDTYKDYSYECTGEYDLDGTPIACLMHTAHGVEDTTESFAHSCNCSFINMGLSLNLDEYSQTAKQLLFNSDLPLDIIYNKSSFSLDADSSRWDIAQTAFGQGKTLITPLHLALIGSAIANDGTLMNPYLVESVENVAGVTIKEFNTKTYGELMEKSEADILKADMKEVINQSFGWLFDQKSYTLAAKSGTAQYGTQGYEHSLFVSFSPADDPQICVTVVVEGGSQRNTSAAEVAKKIYDGYYALQSK